MPTTDPGIPPAARENTIAGAEAFVHYFVQRVNAASTAPDPTLMDSLTSRDCRACAALRETIAADEAAGRHVEGAMWVVQRCITSAFDNQGNATVLLRISQNRVPVMNADGTIDHYLAAEVVDFVVTLMLSRSWLVVRLQGATS